MKLQKIVFVLFLLSVYGCSNNNDGDIDCTTSGLKLTSSGENKATCMKGAEVTLTATGGKAPYTYSLHGAFVASNIFANMAEGMYTAQVKDANDCKIEISISVTGIENTVTLELSSDASGCETSNGKIKVTAGGGDGNFQYQLGTGTFGSSNVFSGLDQGEYSVTVKDGTDCSKTASTKVLSGTSYNASVKNIIKTGCAISGCHVAGTGRQDFSSFSTIQSNATGIKTRTTAKTMPPSGSLSQVQIDQIACWVNDGAKNN